MVDRIEFESTLVEFAHMLLHDVDADEVLRRLTRRVVAVLGVAGAGVSLATPDGVLRVGEATSEVVQRFESTQNQSGEGPCHTAFATGRRACATGDAIAKAWPRFGALLAQEGIHGAAAFPLEAAGTRLGVLDLYWREPRELTPEELRTAEVLADVASVYVLHARRARSNAARYTAELEAANSRLRFSTEIAIRSSRAKGEFLSRTGHELRTPLHAILGFAQLLQLSEHTGEDREAIDLILLAGQHLLDLINDILTISSAESGGIDLTIEPVPVADTVKTAVEMVRPLATGRDVRIEVELADDLTLEIPTDRERLLQVLLSLLSNAARYNPPGGRITVHTAHETAAVRISVSDTGPGHTPEEMAKLFVPFQRLRSTDPREVTGLELALAHTLATELGGTLTIESKLEEGSTFELQLPAYRDVS